MIQLRTAATEVVVVDQRPEDYAELVASLENFHFHFYATGSAALAQTTHASARLWLVHIDLPDISGFELLDRLRGRSTKAQVFLLGDRYRVEDELRGRRLGAVLYACKPPCVAWFTQWRRSLVAR